MYTTRPSPKSLLYHSAIVCMGQVFNFLLCVYEMKLSIIMCTTALFSLTQLIHTWDSEGLGLYMGSLLNH